jgi:hypothetical protein
MNNLIPKRIMNGYEVRLVPCLQTGAVCVPWMDNWPKHFCPSLNLTPSNRAPWKADIRLPDQEIPCLMDTKDLSPCSQLPFTGPYLASDISVHMLSLQWKSTGLMWIKLENFELKFYNSSNETKIL